jgi:hypothetical protein
MAGSPGSSKAGWWVAGIIVALILWNNSTHHPDGTPVQPVLTPIQSHVGTPPPSSYGSTPGGYDSTGSAGGYDSTGSTSGYDSTSGYSPSGGYDSTSGSTTSSSIGCTPGYSPCLPPASDYDCYGGTGDGPDYTGPVRVTGSDPYGLDYDYDGFGCE